MGWAYTIDNPLSVHPTETGRGVWFYHLCFTGVGWVLSKSFSVVKPLLSRIWPGGIDFHWNFYLFTVSVPVGVSELEDSAMHCLGHMLGNKETKVANLLCSLNPNSLANLSPPF